MTFKIDRTIALGDLTMSVAVMVTAGVSIATLLYAWSQDRELLQRQQADQVRTAAAETLAKLERWRGISMSLFEIVQPDLVKASERLVSDRSATQVQQVRDYLYARLIDSRLSVQAALRDEDTENAYVSLFAYRPALRDTIQEALTQLREKEVQMFESLQGVVEAEILAYLKPSIRDQQYMTATLGRALRRAVAGVKAAFEDDVHATLVPLETIMTDLVLESDTQLLVGNSPAP